MSFFYLYGFLSEIMPTFASRYKKTQTKWLV